MSVVIGSDGSVTINDGYGGSITISSDGALSMASESASVSVNPDGTFSASVDLPGGGSASIEGVRDEYGNESVTNVRVETDTFDVSNRALTLGVQGYFEWTPGEGASFGLEGKPEILGQSPEDLADKISGIVENSTTGRLLSSTGDYYDYVINEQSNGRQPMSRAQWLAQQRSQNALDGQNGLFRAAVAWVMPHDPLALDLDGDGIETLGRSDSVLFDHTGGNLVNGTGWVKGDDGLLALDRNGNGLIDSGKELFGVDTVMSNGVKANSGFQALADFDSNRDGKIDGADAIYSSLRVWKDADQDGVTDAGELKSLAEHNIVSINLNVSGGTVALGNGNSTGGSASYTRGDGSTGTAYNLNLAINAYQRIYRDDLPVPAGMANLPNMAGTGQVRDLIQAAMRSPDLAGKLAAFSAATTRDAQMSLLTDLVNAWGNTSEMETSVQAMLNRRFNPTENNVIVYKIPGISVNTVSSLGADVTFATSDGSDPSSGFQQATSAFFFQLQNQNPEYTAWINMLGVLERFNGQTFVNVPKSVPFQTEFKVTAVSTSTSGSTSTTSISTPFNYFEVPLSQSQKALLEKSYSDLKEAIYGSLVVQTRLKPYLDVVGLVVTAEKMTLDFSATTALFEQKKAADAPNAFTDLVELARYDGRNLFFNGWDGAGLLRGWIEQGELSQAVIEAMASVNASTLIGSQTGSGSSEVLLGGAVDDSIYADAGNDVIDGGLGKDTLRGWDGDDIVLGQAGGDSLFGGAGSDLVMGGDGDDSVNGSDFGVYSGDGADFLIGGAGNDSLAGDAGDDYLDGGTGNDYLRGGTSDDVYFFRVGDGQDKIENSQQYGADNGIDTIRFDGSVAVSDIRVNRSADSLFLNNAVTGDSIQVWSHFWSDGHNPYSIDFIEFADGTRWNADEINAIYLSQHQTSADDVLVAFAANEEFHMGAGKDTASGAGGSDIIFGEDGDDSIRGGQGSDTLYGGAGNDLVLGADYGVTSGDSEDFLYGEAGNDTLNGDAGNDWLDGGVGNDRLYGSTGSNIYVFRAGDGQDVIDNAGQYDYENGVEAIRFEAGINAADIRVNRSGTSLLLVNAVTGDSVEVVSHFVADGKDRYSIDQVVFAGEGITWTANDINALYLAQHQTGLADTLIGLSVADFLYMGDGNDAAYGAGGDDVIHGELGNDRLEGQAGNDTLFGGDGGDTILGDVGNDTLVGGAGGDYLSGYLGNNVLTGGTGNDSLNGVDGNNTYIFNVGDGVDTIVNSGFYNTVNGLNVIRFESGVLPADIRIDRSATNMIVVNLLTGDRITVSEHFAGDGASRYSIDFIEFADAPGIRWSAGDINAFYLAQQQTSGDDSIVAFSGAEVFAMGDGKDTVWAGGGNDTASGGAGADTLYGQDGNDLLYGDAGADNLQGGNGDDVLEGGTEADSLQGDAGADTLRGGDGNDSLLGNDGNDVLEGGGGDDTLNGGAGIDLLVGGSGSDSYTVDSASDVVTESLDEGTDLVTASVSYTLAANVENLILTGTAALSGTGNDLANALTGNGGSNTLSGGAGADTLNGGAGTDTLVGGMGDDTYVVDTTTDVITELADEGVDTVQSSVTFTLASLANVEQLRLTGTGAISGTGNALDNVLQGNGSNNTLTGHAGNDTLIGGLGIDTMIGGAGDDSYVVDATTEVITELAGEGNDSVQSSVTFTLSANVDNLTLTGAAGINATGNTLANLLRGNAGANTLTGGLGNDTYLFGRGGAADTLVDNDSTAGNQDVLQLDAGVALDQLWFKQVGTALEVSIIGTADKVTVSNWYGGIANHVEKFQLADGHYLLDGQVDQLVSAMAGMTPPPAGQTTLSEAQHQQLDPVLAVTWQIA